MTSKQLSTLKAVTLKVADLAGDLLGATPLYGGWITLDVNADGYGWYIDSTPMDDKEFATKVSSTGLGRQVDGRPGRADGPAQHRHARDGPCPRPGFPPSPWPTAKA